MKVIVGLGNPGKEYENTRHNVGFNVIDLLSQTLSIPVNKAKCKGLYGQGTRNGEKIFLLKPQTYMNKSGECVQEFIRYFNIPIQDVLVLVDDIDIDFTEIKIKAKGSAGTHNGLKSVIAMTGSQDFPRLKIGVGKKHPGEDLANFVLGRFPRDQQEEMGQCLDRAAEAGIAILDYGVAYGMNHFNGKAKELKS